MWSESANAMAPDVVGYETSRIFHHDPSPHNCAREARSHAELEFGADVQKVELFVAGWLDYALETLLQSVVLATHLIQETTHALRD